MRITKIEIHNFRGICESTICFPLDSRIICMIGAGDSTKSTILKAIEWTFWPSWNLVATDADFYHSDSTKPIIIQTTFAEFPEKLMTEDKFGLYLRQPYAEFGESIDDEPKEGLPNCLTIQITIDASLEPKWEVVCNRQEPRSISYVDRKQIFVGVIGCDVSKDLVWGKHSVLQKYANSKGVLHEAFTAAVRDIAKNADLSELDGISATLVDVGMKLGINFEAEIRSRLLLQGNSFSSAVGLFDGDAPLNQLGTGSQRLLSMGLNIGAAPGEAVLLIDEIETGLEPYRLRNIIHEFRSERNASGQIIMTTHSPVAVAECSIDELMVVHSKAGESKAVTIKGKDASANKAFQKEIRRNAEALLCKRIIICEGKTEMGFIRAVDNYFNRTYKYRMACSGVSTADGGGDNIFNCADTLRDCGYDICILMDSDKEDIEGPKKQRLRFEGVSVFDWTRPYSFEEQCFSELPFAAIKEELQIAIEEKGADSIADCLMGKSIPFNRNNGTIILDRLNKEQCISLGTLAKDKGWYKRIGLAEQFGNIVMENLNELGEESTIKKVVDGLSKWVISNDEAGA